jgi:hypothetical protein
VSGKAERLTLQHVRGPLEGQEVPLETFPAVIGSADGAAVLIPGIADRHAVIERSVRGELTLRDVGAPDGVYLAGQRVREAVLRDGDVVELGLGGPRLRLARQLSRRDQVVELLRGADGRSSPLVRLLQRRAHRFKRNWRLRWTLLGLALLVPLVAILISQIQSRKLEDEIRALRQAMRSVTDEQRAFLVAVEDERRRNEKQQAAMEGQLREFREREIVLNQQLAATASETVERELAVTRERIYALESERAAGEYIIREYGAGVCLIQGSYAYYDSSGRPLRHKLDESGRKMHDDDGQPSLGVDGKGAIYTIDYYGTGFLADRGGLVLSNRHVAVPWWDDDKTEELKRDGFTPRFVLFRAFFPKEIDPFELEPLRHSDVMDLAVLKIDLRRRKIPVLPLDKTGKGAVPGQPVVVVGYPTGLEAILAKADTDVVQSILKRYGRQSEHVTEALSEKGLIRPSTTQGHIGDVTTTDIVFDAPTTQGGSGGPVFNKAGEVVAIEYAVLPKFGGTAFGIPIHFAIDLLRPLRKGARRG